MKKVCFFFLCCLVLFACNDIRVSVGGKGIFTLSLFESWAYLLLLPMYMLVLPIARHYQFKKQHELVFDSPTKLLSLYLLWGLFAAAYFWGDPKYTIQIDYKKLLPGAIAYIGILLLAADDRRKLSVIQMAWFAAGLINVAVAFSQYFFSVAYFIEYSDNAARKLDLTGEVAQRLVVGFGTSANVFAQIIMPWFVVAAIVWLARKKFLTIKSLAWFLLSVLFGFVLFATASKGALVWSTAGIGLGVAMTKWNKLRSSLWFVLLAVTIIAAINGLAVYFKPAPGDSLGTIQSRIDLVMACWRLVIAHPISAIIGGGLKYWDQYAYRWTNWPFYDAHNVYLNQILMYGLIGLFLFGAFIWSCIRRGLRKLDNIQDGLLSPFPYIGAVFAVAGEYWFEPSFKDAMQKYQLFFVLAMLLVVSRLAHSKSDGRSYQKESSNPKYRSGG
ncbi:MAG: O-antigen ligase family protein [Deltaproteobacteria bacterium]